MAEKAKSGTQDVFIEKDPTKPTFNLINVEGRVNHKQKLNTSFHKRGLLGQDHIRVHLTP